MPLYEYQCKKCHSQFEELVRGDEKPACPECQSKAVEKQLSVTSSPSVHNGSTPRELPMMNCGAPRCCGGGCSVPGM